MAKKPNTRNQGVNVKLALLTVLLGLTLGGCARRLEPGGAYAPAHTTTNRDGTVAVTATAAPDLVLFTSDATYRFAYTSLLTVFDLEKQNRALLKTQFPNLKRDCDQLRAQVWTVDQRWAVARQAYLLNPVAANLATVNRIVAELQRLNAVAATLLPVPETADGVTH